MKFLGLRLCDHDSNITYTDGTSVRYIKSERVNQIKHHGYNNFEDYFKDIAHWNIDYSTLDAVAICVDQIKLDFKKEDVLFQRAPDFLPNIQCPVYIVDHHYAHALSCWPVVDTDSVDLAFVSDGVGDFSVTHSIFKKDERVFKSNASGIGVLLSFWGYQQGVQGHPLDISGKVMALKCYGKIYQDFVNNHQHRSILEAQTVFDLQHWLPYLRNDGAPIPGIKAGSLDWIASIHKWLEDKFVEYFLQFAKPDDTITFSGGIAQNICVNSRLKAVFKNLHIIPHNPDDGLSLGCVEFLRKFHNQPKFNTANFPYWQSEVSPEAPSEETIAQVADLLAQGKIVGWFQGQGEIGPRALGNRSILMRPDIKDGKDIINSKVKFREEYRPFGCSVLEEHANDFFDCDYPSPYMLYSVPVRNPQLLSAITHVDGTSRIQTVDKSNTVFYSLLSKFNEKTGLPVLLNTSLNVNKKPIASTIEDAMGVFNTTDIDAMCIGNTLYIK
jgi:carbamoyltransferase